MASLHVPEYIDQSFFELIVKKGLPADADPQEISGEIERGSKAGDNYLSEIFRLKISYRQV